MRKTEWIFLLPPSQRTALFTVYVISIIHATTDLTRLLLAIAVLQMLCFTDVLVREFFRVNSRLKECRK